MDASIGLSTEDGKSSSGFIIMLNGGPIIWSSQKQSIVALSSAEAEYIAASSLAQEILWLQGFLQEIGTPMNVPIGIQEDNQVCIALS